MLGFDVLRGAVIEVLTTGVPANALAWELTSHESWQWSNLEDE